MIPDIMPKGTFDSLKHRGNLKASLGGNGRVVLVEFDSLPVKYQELVVAKYGPVHEYMAMQPLRKLVVRDEKARQYYASYQLENGQYLPLHYQMKYARQADWLGSISKALADKKTLKDELKISITQYWANVVLLAKNDEEEHGLPTSVDRMERRYRLYKQSGYEGLIEAWRFGNDHARVVSPKIEHLIISIYCMPHKPYMNEVCKIYREFMQGKITLVDVHKDTGGELFDPKEFYVKGKPYELGESTVDYYVKKPENVIIINKLRMKGQDYNTQFRPSVKRHAPFFTFSKITMDDIHLPFKGPDGDRVVKSYQVYDCCSEAIIGVAFSEDKEKGIIREAMRDMFRMIVRKGWGIPWEIEMERHLTSAMKGKEDETGEWVDDIFTPGAVFMMTRICQSAQAKRAEGFIKKKKYGFQKKRPGFQGRFYAKNLTNRLNTDQKQLRQAYEVLVQNELEDIAAYNNELHPKQDLYPGLSRWQVLEENQNPNLPKFKLQQVIQHIGYSTATSIRAGVARVMYGDYQLPDIELIRRTNYNGEITAYYLPDDDGIVQSVFLFEDGQFICEAQKKLAFNEAAIEQTDEDRAIMQQQWGQQKKYDKIVKDGVGGLLNVGVLVPNKVVVSKTPRKVVSKEVDMPLITGPKINAASKAMLDI